MQFLFFIFLCSYFEYTVWQQKSRKKKLPPDDRPCPNDFMLLGFFFTGIRGRVNTQLNTASIFVILKVETSLLERNEEMQVFRGVRPLGAFDGRCLKKKSCMCFWSQTAAVRGGFMLFLRTLGFQNVTFNHRHRKQSKC